MSAKASKLVAGAKEWASYYGDYTQGEEAAAFTVPLRARAMWDSNDAEGFAEVFVDNGSFLFGDEQLTSQEQIRDTMKAAFAGPLAGTKLAQEPVEVKLVTPDVAIVITNGGVVAAGATELAQGASTRDVWVTVKRDGVWQLVSLQTSPVKG
ncbi:MAG TPA: SgcJ/EcaC family oxidoreductase [Pseudonocardiaceae bacterium]|nr:SgcJ/EcaC family oxidoreductase [Pseudonocardiaceae bacterium]